MPTLSEKDEQTYDRYPILQFFEYGHLKPELQDIVRRFRDMAWTFANTLPYNTETSTLLRKLLEAKDCAVRSAIYEFRRS